MKKVICLVCFFIFPLLVFSQDKVGIPIPQYPENHKETVVTQKERTAYVGALRLLATETNSWFYGFILDKGGGVTDIDIRNDVRIVSKKSNSTYFIVVYRYNGRIKSFYMRVEMFSPKELEDLRSGRVKLTDDELPRILKPRLSLYSKMKVEEDIGYRFNVALPYWEMENLSSL